MLKLIFYNRSWKRDWTPSSQDDKMQCSGYRAVFLLGLFHFGYKTSILFHSWREILFVLREKVQNSFGNNHLRIKLEIERRNRQGFFPVIIQTDMTVIKNKPKKAQTTFSILKEKGNLKQMLKGRVFRSYECSKWIQKTQWNHIRRGKYPGKPHNVL